jgi:hypothetical protein
MIFLDRLNDATCGNNFTLNINSVHLNAVEREKRGQEENRLRIGTGRKHSDDIAD